MHDFVIENGVLKKYTGTESDVTVPDGVTEIGNRAFFNCKSLTGITIPEGVTSIGKQAFFSCEQLERAELPESVTSIGALAFLCCCALKGIRLSRNVRSIGSGAFSACDSLSRIDADERNAVYASVDGVLYSKDKTTLICCPAGRKEAALAVPDGVRRIEKSAFSGCASLTAVTLPQSVEAIGEDAFAYCDKITVRACSGSAAERYAKENGVAFAALA